MFNKLPFAGEYDALIAPVGTSWPMAQATAPNGWTSSAITDTSFRYNSVSGGSSGGSTNWSSWNFGGTFNVNSFSISVAQMPTHNHGVNDPTHIHVSPGHNHSPSSGFDFWTSTSSGGGIFSPTSGGNSINLETVTNTVGVTINANSTGITTQNNGSGSSITPTITTPQLKYVDHILAVKS
jgi:hypothetical protein